MHMALDSGSLAASMAAALLLRIFLWPVAPSIMVKDMSRIVFTNCAIDYKGFHIVEIYNYGAL